jgi:hypothetical protein
MSGFVTRFADGETGKPKPGATPNVSMENTE